MDNNGVENLVRRILNSVNDMQNSGNDVDSSNHEGQGQNHTVQQELYRRYRIPRDNGTHSETVERSSNTSNAGLLSGQYNPSHNYGYGNSSRRTRQPTPYTRRNQRSASRTASAVPSRQAATTTKEVILLTSPSERVVPKYATKVELHKNGMILDAVEIDRGWSEKQLIEALENLFAHKLNGTR